MGQISCFVTVVLFSGWLGGYWLARESNRTKKLMSVVGVLASLLTVSVPTVMAFALSSSAERTALASQLTPLSLSPHWLLIAVLVPFAGAVVGHFAGVLVSPAHVSRWPSRENLKMALGFLPLALVWGLLEEIGWRGFLFTRLAGALSPPTAALFVGVIWGLWHVPQMLMNDVLGKAFRGRIWAGLVLWLTQCIALSFLLGWLQLRSGTFLIPTVAHALVNAFEKASFGVLGDSGEDIDLRWAGSSGIPAIAVNALMAVTLYRLF